LDGDLVDGDWMAVVGLDETWGSGRGTPAAVAAPADSKRVKEDLERPVVGGSPADVALRAGQLGGWPHARHGLEGALGAHVKDGALAA
jgi:hypothetical protein